MREFERRIEGGVVGCLAEDRRKGGERLCLDIWKVNLACLDTWKTMHGCLPCNYEVSLIPKSFINIFFCLSIVGREFGLKRDKDEVIWPIFGLFRIYES